jgi:hypothetical protein
MMANAAGLKKGGMAKKRASGGRSNEENTEVTGARPTGGRLARASGGKAGKGKTNINIIIGSPHKPGDGAVPPPPSAVPPPPPMPRPMPPQVPMMPPGAGGMPPGGMPPMGAGGPPMAPPMGRKDGGRTNYPIEYGSGVVQARKQKIKSYGQL